MPNHNSKTQLSREQSETLFRIFKKKYDDADIKRLVNNDVIDHIMEAGLDHDPEFEEALHHVAYGNLDKVDDMLHNNSRLLLQAGTVVTRSGLTVKRTTLLECALGAGDPEMADIMLPYFDYIVEGEEVKQSQLERFRPHIEGMMALNYDLTVLFEIIQAASDEDVQQALNKNFNHDSQLNQALQAFREAVRPTEIVTGMHYPHYTTLMQALEKLADIKEWKALSHDYTNYDKCRLIWRQVIGYLKISLPALDARCAAGDFREVRSVNNLNYKNDKSFSDFTGGSEAVSEVGFDCVMWRFTPTRRPHCATIRLPFFKTYIEQKNIKLAELIQPNVQNQKSCVIL